MEQRQAEPGEGRRGTEKAPESGGDEQGGPLRADGAFLAAEVPTGGASCPLGQGHGRQGSGWPSEKGLEAPSVEEEQGRWERGGEGAGSEPSPTP